MSKRTLSDWQTLFTEHEQSGLSAAAFCRERKICSKHFSLRRKQLQNNLSDKKLSPFMPVTITRVSNTTDMIELQQGDVFLKIPMSVSPVWLVDLIHQCQV